MLGDESSSTGLAAEIRAAVTHAPVRGDWTLAGGDTEAASGPFGTGVISGALSRVAAVSFRHYLALSFTAQDAEVTVISRHPLPELPRFDPVTDLQPFCAGWARFTEDVYERLYGPPRPSLT